MKKILTILLFGFALILSGCEIIEQPDSFILEHLDYDGTVLDSGTYDYGADISSFTIVEPDRIGYTFTGWDTVIPDTMPENDVTITATYTINSFNLEHLDYDGTVLDTKPYDYGTDMTSFSIDDPTRTGYTFTGWDINVPDTMPNNNVTITATYEVMENTVQILDYDGTVLNTETLDYGTSLSIVPISDPTRIGYTFTGWDTVIPDTMPENDVTITATYTINSFNLEHLDYDGTVLDTKPYDYGTDMTSFSIDDPTRTGYTFTGWDINVPDTMPNNNVTITATYEVMENTVQILDYDGTVLNTETLDYGTSLSIVPISDPTRIGYTFTGWDTVIPDIMPENDVTITATYTINSFNLEHLDYDGTVLDTKPYDYGTDMTSFSIDEPTRAGYTFTGWDIDVPDTMPNNNVTITATYEVDDSIDLDTTIYVPLGYYDGIDTLSGEMLKDALNDIISGHTEYPYTDKDLDDMDVWKMLRAGDEDPENSDNVLLFYSDFSWAKDCQDTNTSLLPDHCFVNSDRDESYTEWNREHIWSKSHGDFADEDGYEFEETFGGYPLGAHTDAHHLVAAERSMNSVKNNRFFDDCHDGINDDNLVDRGAGNYTCGEWYFEPRDEIKGDVARMLFYMATRYEGEEGDFVDLELTTNLYLYEALEISISSSKLPYYESLEVLLRWHMEDPVDIWELERNEQIYQFQGNRNPFIDHPELVSLIWGTPEAPIEYESTTTE